MSVATSYPAFQAAMSQSDDDDDMSMGDSGQNFCLFESSDDDIENNGDAYEASRRGAETHCRRLFIQEHLLENNEKS